MNMPFYTFELPEATKAALTLQNRQWNEGPVADAPSFRRWPFHELLKRLRTFPAKATVLKGPRQVGKSTLVRQILQTLLSDGTPPKHILYVQFDELPGLKELTQPVLDIFGWYEQNILNDTANQIRRDGGQVFFVLDEVQNLRDWAPQIKFLVDTNDVRLLVTGSSALRIEQGRDSLAGRVSTIEIGSLLLREISEIRGEGSLAPVLPFNGLAPLKSIDFWRELRQFGLTHKAERDRAFFHFSERGGYPAAHVAPYSDWQVLASQLNETVIRRAIVHDLRMGTRGARRDVRLLEEVFRLACRYAGQSPAPQLYVQELQSAMGTAIGETRIFNYLDFLDGTLLIRLIDTLEIRLKKKRGAARICLCDHALRASWFQERIALAPDALARHPEQRDLAGHIAESTAGYFLSSYADLGLTHFPERPGEPEVDFILTIGDQRIPVEIKYRSRIEGKDLAGLRSFIDKKVYNAPFGVLVTLDDSPLIDDPRIVALPLSSLLLMR